MVELKNVSFFYEEGQTENGLHHINLKIKQGEVIVLCGESGCGKTTLTRLINGLIPNYYEGILSGEVLINKKEVNKLPLYETAKIVGSVFQNPRSQFFNVDTTSEIAFGCENKGLPVQEIKRRIAETVREFKIEALMDRSIFQLSGGEKQKIACASVSVSQPEVFVLDEPSSNLDTVVIEDLRELIEIWKNGGKTVIIAEHRLYFLRELADRIIYMKDGKIENEFTAMQIKQMDNKTLYQLGLRPLSLENLKVSAAYFRNKEFDLNLSDFRFSYTGQAPAINIENLILPKGSIIAIIGHNGAGKSTFARCLCGLEKRCKGAVKIGGKILKGKERLKNCYMVMQDVNHQLFTESVLEEVLLSLEQGESRSKESLKNEKAEEILAGLDLLPMKEFHPMSLSGGEKQRVAIAGAIASKKDIILFDEPTSGLDLRHMGEVAKNLKQLQKMGKTLFVISHDLEFILSCCNHVLELEKGEVIDNYPLEDAGEQKLFASFLKERWKTELNV